jgi:hypothetical protein
MATMLQNLDHMAYGNPKFGSFWMGFKIDFAEYPTEATGDSYRCGKVRDGWLIRDCWYRMPTASSQTSSTIDIGFGAAGQSDIASAVDANGSLLTWTQGTITSVASAELEITADEHLVLTVDAEVISSGVLEVMYLVMAGIDENEPADANIDD